MLSLIVFLAPATGCLLLFFMREKDAGDRDRIRKTALGFCTVSLVASLLMWWNHDTGPDAERWQFLFEAEWVPSIGLAYLAASLVNPIVTYTDGSSYRIANVRFFLQSGHSLSC